MTDINLTQPTGHLILQIKDNLGGLVWIRTRAYAVGALFIIAVMAAAIALLGQSNSATLQFIAPIVFLFSAFAATVLYYAEVYGNLLMDIHADGYVLRNTSAGAILGYGLWQEVVLLPRKAGPRWAGFGFRKPTLALLLLDYPTGRPLHLIDPSASGQHFNAIKVAAIDGTLTYAKQALAAGESVRLWGDVTLSTETLTIGPQSVAWADVTVAPNATDPNRKVNITLNGQTHTITMGHHGTVLQHIATQQTANK